MNRANFCRAMYALMLALLLMHDAQAVTYRCDGGLFADRPDSGANCVPTGGKSPRPATANAAPSAAA
ncbi:MAG: hypothetical protein ACT4PG_03535 [Panacagrimonas sp.]